MSKLSDIEKQILELERKIHDDEHGSFLLLNNRQIDSWRSEIKILETKRNFILDKRDSWLPKTIWMFAVPILVTIITSIILKVSGF